MSSESESFTPEGAENFVAPDVSQRIENPETAESIARRSHLHRSEAAENRAAAGKIREKFEDDVSPAMEVAKKNDMLAHANDEIAQAHEQSEKEFLTKP